MRSNSTESESSGAVGFFDFATDVTRAVKRATTDVHAMPAPGTAVPASLHAKSARDFETARCVRRDCRTCSNATTESPMSWLPLAAFENASNTCSSVRREKTVSCATRRAESTSDPPVLLFGQQEAMSLMHSRHTGAPT